MVGLRQDRVDRIPRVTWTTRILGGGEHGHLTHFRVAEVIKREPFEESVELLLRFRNLRLSFELPPTLVQYFIFQKKFAQGLEGYILKFKLSKIYKILRLLLPLSVVSVNEHDTNLLTYYNINFKFNVCYIPFIVSLYIVQMN